jgi:hypothetical protein
MSEFTKNFDEFLDADNIKFDKIELYVYLPSEDLFNDAQLNLNFKYPDKKGEEPVDHTDGYNLEKPDNGAKFEGLDLGTEAVYKGTLPVQYNPIDVTDIFNDRPEQFWVEATVELPTKATIKRGGDNDFKVHIEPDLVIKLPVKLRLTSDGGGENESDVVLDMSKMLPGEKGSDLLNRNSDDDYIAENVKDLNLTMDFSYTNNLGNGLTLVIGSNELNIKEQSGSTSISFTLDDIKYPFRPAIKLKVPKKEDEDYALLALKRETGEDTPGFAITTMNLSTRVVIDREFPED